MHFIWILIVMASYLSDDEEYSSLVLTQQSNEINVMDISSEEDDGKTNFELLLESARELTTSQVSNFDDKIFEMDDNSEHSENDGSQPSSPVFVASSMAGNLQQIEVCLMFLRYM